MVIGAQFLTTTTPTSLSTILGRDGPFYELTINRISGIDDVGIGFSNLTSAPTNAIGYIGDPINEIYKLGPFKQLSNLFILNTIFVVRIPGISTATVAIMVII